MKLGLDDILCRERLNERQKREKTDCGHTNSPCREILGCKGWRVGLGFWPFDYNVLLSISLAIRSLAASTEPQSRTWNLLERSHSREE